MNKYFLQNKISRNILEKNNKFGVHNITYKGIKFVINKNVFSPKIFNAWKVFTPFLSKLDLEGKNMLEIGAGSGITGLYLLFKNNLNSITLTDINPYSVDNIKLNSRLLEADSKTEILESDIFNEISLDKKFDIIYWNFPWLVEEESYDYKNILERGLFDPGYKLLERYIGGLKKYLSNNGRAFIGFGDFGDIEKLKEISQKNNFLLKECINEKGLEGNEVKFILYEFISK